MKTDEINHTIQQLEGEIKESDITEEFFDVLRRYKGEDEIITSKQLRKEIKNEAEPPWEIATKLPSLDKIIGGFRGGDLVIISGPTASGKTKIAETFTWNLAEQKIGVCWFSYEMANRELLERFGENMPTFYLPRKINSASLKWIEERITESIAKSKNQPYEVKAIVIDHLHYLFDLSQVKNSSLELGAIVRLFKKIALKWNIVVFLIAHTKMTGRDERLGIHSLRDCLPMGQMIYSNGSYIPIESIKNGNSIVSRKSMKLLQNDTILDIWPTGKKRILKIKTKTGREIRCSNRHKFYAMTKTNTRGKFGPNQNKGILGWTEAKNLIIGQKIAVVRKYPDIGNNTFTKEQVLLLGWIIGDGHISKQGYTEITTETEKEAKFICKIARKAFKLSPKYSAYKDKKAFRIYLVGNNTKNQLARWFRKHNFVYTGKNKRVPDEIWTQTKENIAIFLSGLFHADGSSSLMGNYKSVCISFQSISRQLAIEVQRLLLRLGIISTFRKLNYATNKWTGKKHNLYGVYIYSSDVMRFRDRVGFQLHKQKKLEKQCYGLIPKRRKIERDILYERIVSIEKDGREETFDVSVKGHHHSLKNNSFCINDFITHNSSFVGQESDFVLMVARKYADDNEEGKIYEDTTKISVQKNRRTGKTGSFEIQIRDNKFMEIEKEYDKMGYIND